MSIVLTQYFECYFFLDLTLVNFDPGCPGSILINNISIYNNYWLDVYDVLLALQLPSLFAVCQSVTVLDPRLSLSLHDNETHWSTFILKIKQALSTFILIILRRKAAAAVGADDILWYQIQISDATAPASRLYRVITRWGYSQDTRIRVPSVYYLLGDVGAPTQGYYYGI